MQVALQGSHRTTGEEIAYRARWTCVRESDWRAKLVSDSGSLWILYANSRIADTNHR